MDRYRTELRDKPGQSPANRSLERGIELLRAFRPGSELLGNGELAERTGLSKATVSRLTQTLVGAGMLQAEPAHRAYRLAPGVLSLAHAMRGGSHVLSVAAPLMRRLAEGQRINVGLAAADRDEMVYLESIRYNRRVVLRHVLSGQRVPMELTSLGMAYLAVVPEKRRIALMDVFRERRGRSWAGVKVAIERARESVKTDGFCSASWQPEVVAIAAPLVLDGAIYAMNLSVSTPDPMEQVVSALSPHLLRLVAEVQRSLESQRALAAS